MDQNSRVEVSKTISEAKSLGYTNEQILQRFVDQGWKRADIENVLTSMIEANPPIQNSLRFNKRFVLIGALLIMICVISLVIFFLLKKPLSKKAQTQSKVHQQSDKVGAQNLDNSIPSNIVSVTEFESTRAEPDKIKIYDLDTMKLIPINFPWDKSPDVSVDTYPWSPDGNKIPIEHRDITNRQIKFFVYDVTNNQVDEWLSLSPEELDKNELSYLYGPEFYAGWLDNDSIVVPQSADAIIISKGSFKKIQRTGVVYGNRDFQVKYNFAPAPQTSIVNNGMETVLSLQPSEIIIGVIDNRLITSQEILNKSTSLDDLAKSVELLISPKETIITIYSLSDMKKITSFTLTKDWQTNRALLRKQTNSIIIMQTDKSELVKLLKEGGDQQDKNKSVYNLKSRFMEMSLADGTQNILYEGILFPPLDPLMNNDKFGLTANGEWLVFLEGSALNAKAIALNLRTKEKFELCSTKCRSLRVFNPNEFRPR